MDVVEDGVIGVQPVLRPRPFDAGAAFTRWLDAGRPLPSDEDGQRIVREGHIEDPRWVTGGEHIRPPTNALEIAFPKRGHIPTHSRINRRDSLFR